MNAIFIDVKDKSIQIGLIKEDRWIGQEELLNNDKRDDLYLGRVLQDLKGQKAYIVEYEKGEKGFLTYSKTSKVLKPGETVIVQYIKNEGKDKYPRLQSNYMILGNKIHLLPELSIRRFSKKGKNKIDLNQIQTDYGFILSSRGIHTSIEELEEELKSLAQIQEKIEKEKNFLPVPRKLLSQNRRIGFFLDQHHEKVETITTNSKEIYKFYKNQYENLVLQENYDYRYDSILQRDLQNLNKKKIQIDEDSDIIFEETESMIVVDVNLKASKEKLHRLIPQTNAKAVYEMAIQMELRSLTGIVIIDCINMKAEDKENFNNEVKKILRDFPKLKYHGLTKLNLAQFIRQR